MRKRGALPFGEIAGEMLVALANPMDEELKKAVAGRLACPCHFYLALPQSLAAVLGRLFPETRK